MAWLHETFKGAYLTLAYEVSARMAADIYTKAFIDPERWKSACLLVGVCDPKELDDLARRSKEWEQPLPQSGGTTPHSPNSQKGALSKIFADSLACATSGAVLVDPCDRSGASTAGSSGVVSDSFAASGGATHAKERKGKRQEHTAKRAPGACCKAAQRVPNQALLHC